MYIDRWIEDHLRPGPARRWKRRLVGDGAALLYDDSLRLVLPRATHARYSNAQLDDYLGLSHARYPWRPPLRLTVRARFGGNLIGTAGFGFWNHPFVPLPIPGVPLALAGTPIPPRAIWFFHASPPNDMALARGVPGHGWKAATLDAISPRALRWAPLAPAVMLLNHWPPTERRIWPRVQHDLQIGETLIATATHDWHDYQIEWRGTSARFMIDGATIMETECAPGGPLGFVAWIDNQYAVATRWGRLGYGLLDAPTPQYLDLASIYVEALYHCVV